MTDMTSYDHGTFSWVELSTTDPEGAKSFYSSLFGWKAEDMPAGDTGATYTMCKIDGKYVSAIQQIFEEMRAQGVPPHWMSYVTVDDVDMSADKVPSLGGTVVVPPFDVMDVGRMAVIQDPTGATLSLWQAKDHIGAGLIHAPGSLSWNELSTNDTAAAGAFYSSLLGWDADEQDMGGMKYTVFKVGESSKGGMSQITGQMGDMPPAWSVSFAVSDVDESAAKISELGGTIVMPPTDYPGGRFAVAQDPQGAFFGIVRVDDPA